jgi:hypothetical protein
MLHLMIMHSQNLHRRGVEEIVEYVVINSRNHMPHIQHTGATPQNAPIIITNPLFAPTWVPKESLATFNNNIHPIIAPTEHMQQEHRLGTNNYNNDKSTDELGTKKSLVTFNNNIEPIIVPTKDTQQEQSSGTNNDNNDSNGKLNNSIKERKEENGSNATDSLDGKADLPITSTFSNCSYNDSTYTTITTSDHWDIIIDY